MSAWGQRWHQTRLRSLSTSHTALSRKCGFLASELWAQRSVEWDQQIGLLTPDVAEDSSMAPVWRCPKCSMTACSNSAPEKEEVLFWDICHSSLKQKCINLFILKACILSARLFWACLLFSSFPISHSFFTASSTLFAWPYKVLLWSSYGLC